MKFRVELEVTERGILANGQVLTHVRTMHMPDRRFYTGGITSNDKRLVYRRDLVRKELKECYQVNLPRGAEIGTKWTIEVEVEKFWGWYHGDADDVTSFEDEDYDAYSIDMADDDVPVTPNHLVGE